MSLLAAGPAHGAIVERVVARWPEHAEAVARALPDDAAVRATVEEVSRAILSLVGGDLDRYVDGYRWMCAMVLDEELAFRRSGRYRHASFAEVERAVYADSSVMAPYMDGLLLSQVLWGNHISILDFYARTWVGAMAGSARHLEVGPGHGLLLWLASRRCTGTIEGWDVSDTSLARTRAALDRLGAPPIALSRRNLFAPDDGARFDSIVLSEVLEHLERPAEALAALRERLAPGGLLFANAPVNSPAIDHIYLFRNPEEVVEMVARAGFSVEATRFAPATGTSEARARKMRFSISTAVIARKSA